MKRQSHSRKSHHLSQDSRDSGFESDSPDSQSNATNPESLANTEDLDELDEVMPLLLAEATAARQTSSTEKPADCGSEPTAGEPLNAQPIANGLYLAKSSTPQSFTFVATSQDQGRRIDAYLAEQFPELSRVKLRKTISGGNLCIDGEVVKPAFRLEEGQNIQLTIPPDLFDNEQKGEAISLDILWEDDDVIAINKSAGMVVHPAKGHWRGTLTSGLIHRFQQLSSIGGATRPGIVHRLDRDTSGVILVAKNDQAHMHLVEQFQNRTIEKEYWAIVSPAPNFDQDRIDLPIGKHPYQRERMAIRENHPTSRPAETLFQVVERMRGFAVLRVLPKTGRTHQIRVHLAHVGCPVLCDRLYSGRASLTEAMLHGGVDQAAGNDQSALLNRQALHAHRITFQHPKSNQSIRIEAPLPADLELTRAALQKIRSL